MPIDVIFYICVTEFTSYDHSVKGVDDLRAGLLFYRCDHHILWPTDFEVKYIYICNVHLEFLPGLHNSASLHTHHCPMLGIRVKLKAYKHIEYSTYKLYLNVLHDPKYTHVP